MHGICKSFVIRLQYCKVSEGAAHNCTWVELLNLNAVVSGIPHLKKKKHLAHLVIDHRGPVSKNKFTK